MEDEALANDQLRENSPQEGVVVYKVRMHLNHRVCYFLRKLL